MGNIEALKYHDAVLYCTVLIKCLQCYPQTILDQMYLKLPHTSFYFWPADLQPVAIQYTHSPVEPDEQMLTQHCISRPVSTSDQDRNAKTTGTDDIKFKTNFPDSSDLQ